MQVLMQLERKRFRDMPAFLELLASELELSRTPCFSTINKFALRIKSMRICSLISNLVKSNQRTLVAIDGTGFSLIKRSTYFSTIAGEIKQFIQCVAVADIKRKLITAAKLRRRKRNENIDVNYLMKSTKKQVPVDIFLADKSFDSKKNHDRAEKYRARFIAPKFKTQKNEILFRVMVYNAERLVNNSPELFTLYRAFNTINFLYPNLLI